MLITDLSVKRPVFATVLSLLLVAFGFITYERLPLREYPDIDSPIITINTAYTGASASVVETKITQIVEDSVSGLEGLKTIESSSEDGKSSVSLEFNVNRNIDEAANDVRDKISRISGELPDEADAPEISKASSGGIPDLILGVSHPTMTQMELTDYADRNLVDRFSVVDGVAQARIYGEKRFSMRVWLDRRALAARKLTVEDIETALNAENVELPAGRLESSDREFTLRVKRGYRTAEDFRKMVISRGENGHLVRLGDLAKIEIAPATLRDSFQADGKNAIGLGVSRQSKANTLAMIEGVKKLMEKIKPDLPKGMEMVVLRDSSIFIKASVHEVFMSLALAAALVIGVIFLFLGNARAAIIPSVSVPISLLSSFIVIYAMGFSINLLTLLALVLAIGLVVDDSIIVLENIHRRMEEGEPPLLAAFRGAREVGMAVLATTMVLVAVFVPISLMQGDTGKLFTEFAFAIAGAVVFSCLVSLTLTPMLCSKVLKPQNEEGLLAKFDEAVFQRAINLYGRMLRRLVRHPLLGLGALILLGGSVWVLLGRIQTEFEPQEDRAVLITSMTAPEGTGFTASLGYMKEVTKRMNKLVESKEAKHVLSITPGSHNSQGAVNSGFGVIELKPWSERERPAQLLGRELFIDMMGVTGARVFVIQPPGLSGFFGQPIQFVIGGPTYEELVKWRDLIVQKAKAYPGLIGLDADYKETTPQYRVAIDRDRAAELGVSSKTIGRTLETVLGSRQVTTYIDNGEEYDVILQGNDSERRSPADLQNIYVRSSRTNQLIPLSNLVSMEERADASTLRRHNRTRAITISGSIAPGYSMGDCLAFLEKTVREELPATAIISYKGMSQKLKEASGSVIFVFALALLVAYLVLSAQFESFVSPFVIMLTVPMGVLGAFLGMLLMGVTLNIYSQIGLVMLIGLAAKNGILIVEFANQLRDRGMPFDEAVFHASQMRLRPIVMTGICTAIGALPLIFATGAGAMSRIAIGSVIFFGAATSCFLTLFIVPMGYYHLSRSQASPKELERKLEALAAAQDSHPSQT